jgi:general stress protein 26
MKADVLTYLQKHQFCVLSTVDANGRPQSAFVGFTVSDNLELLIGTSNQSRKYRNIMLAPTVSMVVGDTEGTVQYEGEAHVIDSQEEQQLLSEHFGQVPGSAKYRQDPTQVWLKITPAWVRFTRHGAEDSIEELKEF